MERRTAVGGDALAAEIVGLSQLRIKELRKRWKAMYGRAPSLELGRSFLIRAIAYRMQERVCGGLKPSTRRLLAEAEEQTATGSSLKVQQIRKAQSGTILVREWRGNAHRVTMLDDGVSFKGKLAHSRKWHARLPAAAGQDLGSSG